MTVLVCVNGRNNDKLISELHLQLPNEKIQMWPKHDNLDEVEFVLAWNAPSELWAQLPNLKVIQSYGAGVDGIDLEQLPSNIQVTRIVDEHLARDMSEYVLTHILAHKLRLKEYFFKQQAMIWKPRRALSVKHIGIMGMGQLGLSLAKQLQLNHFKVSGWSRSDKVIEQVNHFHGEAQLNTFLNDLDVLVCLLPLTPHTENILNLSLFRALPSHCLLINVARGKHLNEEDLLTALANDEISAAVLDVFNKEPLSSTHPFWSNERITITPHCAALTQLEAVCEQVAKNVQAMNDGKKLNNLVNNQIGY